jgi:uncharacterized protein YndB with AHSA1/START domain
VKAKATRELLAPVEDVWAFVAEPRRLADWWPGLAAVEPDETGLVPGARWELRPPARRRGRLRPPSHAVVRRVEPPSLLAWHQARGALEVELRLEPVAASRTRATLTIAGRVVIGTRRELPRAALLRLYHLCQTGAAA